MWEYNYTNELYHYGVPGMRWGHRKAVKLANKASISRESSKEWNQMARYAESKGKTKKAAKYRKYANNDLKDARKYESMSGSRKPSTKKKNPKKTTKTGKKTAKKTLQKIGGASLKSVSYAAQLGARVMQNYGNQQRIKYWTNDW